MTLTRGSIRENLVVEFVEGRVIAWNPAEPGQAPVGHLWRWEVQPIDEQRSLVVHTYDWTELNDLSRYARAQATTSERLSLSLARLAVLLERDSDAASEPDATTVDRRRERSQRLSSHCTEGSQHETAVASCSRT